MKPEQVNTTSFSAGLLIRGFGVLLPARARSWVWPPHLLQPSPYCLQGTWAEVPAQPALGRDMKKGEGFFTCISTRFIILFVFHLQKEEMRNESSEKVLAEQSI